MNEDTQVAGVILNEVDGDGIAGVIVQEAVGDEMALDDRDIQPCL